MRSAHRVLSNPIYLPSARGRGTDRDRRVPDSKFFGGPVGEHLWHVPLSGTSDAETHRRGSEADVFPRDACLVGSGPHPIVRRRCPRRTPSQRRHGAPSSREIAQHLTSRCHHPFSPRARARSPAPPDVPTPFRPTRVPSLAPPMATPWRRSTIAQVERHQQREQLAAIEREAGELWKEVERSHLKTQFAREILRAAEDEHVTRKGQYDAIAARLEDAIRTTNDAEETFKRREAAFFAATGRQARPESRPQHPREPASRRNTLNPSAASTPAPAHPRARFPPTSSRLSRANPTPPRPRRRPRTARDPRLRPGPRRRNAPTATSTSQRRLRERLHQGEILVGEHEQLDTVREEEEGKGAGAAAAAAAAAAAHGAASAVHGAALGDFRRLRRIPRRRLASFGASLNGAGAGGGVFARLRAEVGSDLLEEPPADFSRPEGAPEETTRQLRRRRRRRRSSKNPCTFPDFARPCRPRTDSRA